MAKTVDDEHNWQRTLDLALLARIDRGDRVKVESVADSTQDLFEKTLALVQTEAEAEAEAESEAGAQAGAEPDAGAVARAADPEARYVPENRDLRTIYLLAEAVGGYERFHDLVNVHSPGSALSKRFDSTAQQRSLREEEVRILVEYQRQIHQALTNANTYLRERALYELSHEELRELHDVILAASARARELNRIMGVHLMHEIERAVQRLHEIETKLQNVEQTVDGIFLVDSEVMFIPTIELIEIVNTVFEGIGNSYLSENIDGVLLLAARNLIIEVAAFHSFYGKHQIYNVLKRGGSNVSTHAITARIRYEIRKLFEACKQDNRLVLTRIMKDAQREFELSVDAIQSEAEQSAIATVSRLIPPDQPVLVPKKKGLLRRVLGWLGLG